MLMDRAGVSLPVPSFWGAIRALPASYRRKTSGRWAPRLTLRGEKPKREMMIMERNDGSH